jgi:RNA polymerase sigma factor (sigma-70 family)
MGVASMGQDLNNERVCLLASDTFDAKIIRDVQTYFERLRLSQTPSCDSSAAWARFYLICDVLLRRFAKSCHVDPSDLDDCVQAAWKDIVVALPKFKHQEPSNRFHAWLHLIVHSKAIDLRRSRARRPVKSLTPTQEATLPSKSSSPVVEYELLDRKLIFERVMASMRERESSVNYRLFQLCCVDGRSALQAEAELNHLSVHEIRYRCYRMRRKFRRLYEIEAKKAASYD